MKLFMSIMLLTLLAWLIPTWDRTPEKSGERPSNEIVTVDFCELMKNPAAYDKKVVRTRAIYRYGGEDLSHLYCPECLSEGMSPYFADSACTKLSVAAKLTRQKHSSGGIVRVTVVGLFESNAPMTIRCVESAYVISKKYYLPDRLSPKERKRIHCD